MSDYSKLGLIKVNDFWVRCQLDRVGKVWIIYKIPNGKEENWKNNLVELVGRIPSSESLSAKQSVKIWEEDLRKKG